MSHFGFERLEGRALMSAATVVHGTEVYDLNGPAALVAGVEPIDLTAKGTTRITEVVNDRRFHLNFQETLVGAGPGLETGVPYEFSARAVGVDNYSFTNGSGVSHFVFHAQATSAEGGTVRQVYIFHGQTGPNGEVRIFEKGV